MPSRAASAIAPGRSRALRAVYLVLGSVSVGLATAGIVLPLVPTTPLVLLAAFCFARSSPRFDRWLVEHRVFGPIVRDWRAGAGFTRRAKLVAVGAILITFGVTLTVAVDQLPVRVVLASLAVAVIAYILTRPTKPPVG